MTQTGNFLILGTYQFVMNVFCEVQCIEQQERSLHIEGFKTRTGDLNMSQYLLLVLFALVYKYVNYIYSSDFF